MALDWDAIVVCEISIFDGHCEHHISTTEALETELVGAVTVSICFKRHIPSSEHNSPKPAPLILIHYNDALAHFAL